MIEWIILGIVLLAVLAALIYVYFTVKPAMPYLYLSSMLQSRSGQFLDDRKLSRLTESKNLKEFSDQLTSTFYDVDGEDVAKLHDLFDKKYFAQIDEIYGLAPKEFQKLIDVYLLTYESAIVKLLYKSKLQKRAIDSKFLYAVGSLDENLLTKGASTTDFDEFKALFTGTLYAEVVKKSYSTISDFESVLDKMIYTEISSRLSKLKIADKKLISHLFTVLVDQRNVMSAFQQVIRGQETVFILVGAGKLAIGSLDTQALQNCTSVDEIISYLQNTHYADMLLEAKSKFDKDGSVSHFDIAMERYMRKFIIDMGALHPQGAFSVFGFILRSRMDKQNVQVVSKGIEANMQRERIAEILI